MMRLGASIALGFVPKLRRQQEIGMAVPMQMPDFARFI
jgi:hypothetical protein